MHNNTLQFGFLGELDNLEKTIRCLLEKKIPDLLYSYGFASPFGASTKTGYKLAKKILNGEYGKKLQSLGSNVVAIVDKE